jgi:hypothetical protein
MPPAARGFFLQKPPPGPPQKLFIKQKFLEVQKPFFKKVFGRRRQKWWWIQGIVNPAVPFFLPLCVFAINVGKKLPAAANFGQICFKISSEG